MEKEIKYSDLTNAVQTIKDEILQGQKRALETINQEQLRAFFEEWRMLSDNSFVETNKLESDAQNSFVPTYKTTVDMNDRFRKLLPPVEELEKLL